MTIIATLALQTAALLTFDARPACAADAADRPADCAAPARMTARMNGAATTLLVQPGGDDDLVCNADAAARARLSARGESYMAQIGSVDVAAPYANVAIALPAPLPPLRVRAVWPAGRPVATADCKIGPNAFGDRAVRFVLGPERADAVSTTFRRSGTRDDVYADLRYGRERVQVRFELDYAETVLTAPATRVVARDTGGSVTGPVVDLPILYGVERPARRIVTRTPLRVGTMTLAAPYARVDDYGNARTVRSIDPATIAGDDILVAGRATRITGSRLIRVGRYDLLRCVSLTVERYTVTLVC